MRAERTEVTKGALVARIKRKLAHDGDTFSVTRERWENNLGAYHVVDSRNCVVWVGRTDSDLEEYARGIGVLRSDEQLAAEGS